LLAELKHKESFCKASEELKQREFVYNAPAAVIELERKKQEDAEVSFVLERKPYYLLKKITLDTWFYLNKGISINLRCLFFCEMEINTTLQ
jgi:hypothetical protein